MPFAQSEAVQPTSGYPKKSRASLFNLVADILIRRGEFKKVQKWIDLSLTEFDHAPTYESILRLCLAANQNCDLDFYSARILPHRLPQVLLEFSSNNMLRGALCQPFSKNGKLLETCGILSRKDADFESAKEFLLAGLANFRAEAEKFTTYANLGGIFHLQGDTVQAENFYSKALKIRPQDETIMKNMALLTS